MSKKTELDSLTHHQLLKYAEDLVRLHKDLKEEQALLIKANQELVSSYYQTIIMGFDLICLNNQFLGGHCKRVSHYTGDLAEALGLDEKAKISAKLSGLLHDIGLIGVPRKILINILAGREKSKENLDIYRQHPNVNIRPITSTERFKDMAHIISAHHEKMNGSGFPKGLKGTEIPVESRIIAIASGYDIIKQLSDRAIDPEKAVSKMEKDVGSAYDINIFKKFKEIILKRDPFTDHINIGVDELTPGMVLAKPISIGKEIILLSAETILRADHIIFINRFLERGKLESPISIYKQNEK